jgi:nucleotide-binding universal stress UspA family protein
MRKLLVAYDGSDNAMRALRHAIGLVKEAGTGSLHVVMAHEEPVVYGEIAVYVTPEKMAELQRKQCEAMLASAHAALADARLPYTVEVLTGPVGETIARRADELGCDGIVMGTHGHTAIGNLVMGSVATKVVHFAHVPVTLVK